MTVVLSGNTPISPSRKWNSVDENIMITRDAVVDFASIVPLEFAERGQVHLVAMSGVTLVIELLDGCLLLWRFENE